MEKWHRTMPALLVLSLLLVASVVNAASISGRLSAVAEWYENVDGDTVAPGYLYGQIAAKDLDNNGLNFKMYGRVAEDLNNTEEVESRLYYAYLEKDNLFPHVGFRLGRQYVTTADGLSIMDGLKLNLTEIGPLGFSVYGGVNVDFEDEMYDNKKVIFGGEASGQFSSLSLAASYVQQQSEGYVEKEVAGFDGELDLFSALRLYGDTQYNMITDTVSFVQTGLDWYGNDTLGLKLEYLYSVPVFETSSIYSVFAVDAYEEVSAVANITFGKGYRSFVRYTYEMYEEYDDSNVYEVGFEKIRTKKFAGYVSGIYRDDDGEEMKGGKIYASYRAFDMVTFGAGAAYDVLERNANDEDDTTSERYWADLSADFGKNVSLDITAEHAKSELYDYYDAGRVRLTVKF